MCITKKSERGERVISPSGYSVDPKGAFYAVYHDGGVSIPLKRKYSAFFTDASGQLCRVDKKTKAFHNDRVCIKCFMETGNGKKYLPALGC